MCDGDKNIGREERNEKKDRSDNPHPQIMFTFLTASTQGVHTVHCVWCSFHVACRRVWTVRC